MSEILLGFLNVRAHLPKQLRARLPNRSPMYLIKHDTIDVSQMQDLMASLLVRIQEEEMVHQMA